MTEDEIRERALTSKTAFTSSYIDQDGETVDVTFFPTRRAPSPSWWRRLLNRLRP